MSERVLDWDKPLRFTDTNLQVFLRYTLKAPRYRRVCTWMSDETGIEYCDVFHEQTAAIENVPEKREYWVNVYRNDDGEVRVTSIPYRSCESASMDLYLASKGKRLCPPIKIYEEEVQP